jgi:hypothetical protein
MVESLCQIKVFFNRFGGVGIQLESNEIVCHGHVSFLCQKKWQKARKSVEKRLTLNKNSFVNKSFTKLLSARDWIRTSTSLRTLPPEDSASTNFATRAQRFEVRSCLPLSDDKLQTSNLKPKTGLGWQI